MTNEKLYEVLGDINENHINEARAYHKAKKPGWVKWGVVAACFAMIAVLGVGIFQSGLFGNKTDIATLENGTEIVFVKSEMTASSIDVDGAVTTRQLTEDEIATLFPNLPVTAHAIFKTSDMDAGNSPELIGFEGNIGNAKIVISTTNISLLDTEIRGNEAISTVNGTSVTAGYFVTDPNSNGEQNAIYYATFEIDGCKVYLENAGTKADSETQKIN